MDEKRQIQKELFEEFAGTGKKKHAKGVIYPKIKKSFNLSYEHIVFIFIGIIIACVVSFSLGVEKGKSIKAKKAEAITEEEIRIPAAHTAETVVEEPAIEIPVEPEKEEGPVYTVRVASYFKESTAEKEMELLKGKGIDSFTYQSGRYYVVCVGRFEDKKKARSEQRKLLKSYPDCYVKKQ